MSKINVWIVAAMAAICLSTSISVAQADSMRTWTSISGATLEARYVLIERGELLLEREDGAWIGIHLSQLSEADRAIALELAQSAGHIDDLGTGALTTPSADHVPVFADGMWKGYHTVYHGRTYRVLINQEMRATIHLLDNGEKIGPAIIEGIGAMYADPSKPAAERHTRRRVARVEKHAAPAIVEGRQVRVFEGTFDDEVAFVKTFEMEPTSLKLVFHYIDPPRIDHGTTASHSLTFEPSLSPGPETSLEQIKKLTDGWTIEVNGPGRSRGIIHFWQSMQTVQGIDQATMTGPWGPRIISIAMPPVRDRDTRYLKSLSLYSGNSPYNGFALSGFVVGNRRESVYQFTFR